MIRFTHGEVGQWNSAPSHHQPLPGVRLYAGKGIRMLKGTSIEIEVKELWSI